MKSASLNKRAVETKYQDLVRLTIDNLYTSYVDALVAQRNSEGIRSIGTVERWTSSVASASRTREMTA
jgi:hypothetical protein